jgi:YfiH family protein
MFAKDDRGIYRAIPLTKLDWLEHGFGTRHSDWSGCNPTTLKQIHSDRILIANGSSGCAGEGDALITNQAGTMIAVRTADCLPILLVEEQERLVSVVHAGWRGTAAGITAKTVRAIVRDFGGRPERIHGAIGPGIGVCCYRVGREVADRFQTFLPDLKGNGEHIMLNLAEANRRQLLSAGVRPERIYTGAPCTCCTLAEFHSYRREPENKGRMISVGGILQKH